jgi:hypothetical protein
MKGDGEGKMNAVEKQCVVHVSSRPAIVGTSQSVTLLIWISFLTSKALSSLESVTERRQVCKSNTNCAIAEHQDVNLGR